MELKNYQEDVLQDLKNYIDNILKTKNPSKAYTKLWNDKQVRVGYDGMPTYKDNIPGVPSVCLKVPTGGGKTLIACASLKVILDRMSANKKKVVVWLVPWDTILSQTYNALSNPNHFYRQRLNRDFSSKVEIYSKKQALSGQNFNPSTINEQLSVIILSFDSLRSKNKESRKIYEENSNLSQFTDFYSDKDSLVKSVDESALIQVLNQLNPIVVVDESHNATSDLSIEMIKNLNPSFVVELTATPRQESNIISIVSAERLKQANMVKLPVIAYNRPSVERVIVESIDLRNALEKSAKSEQSIDQSAYIRPIVLFQAQPKNDEDNVTFEKIKENLIACGIPSDQIAIKTSNKNEIGNIDLMSPDCKIRYIITVNALKEGWDCPFAYILASLANKTSRVDVEQIVGRILRQPNQREYKNKLLNMSYVLTCSADFNSTLNSILVGLNSAGFSKNDCRVIETKETKSTDTESQNGTIFDHLEEDQKTADTDASNFNIDSVTAEIKSSLKEQDNQDNNLTKGPANDLIDNALKQGNDYQEQIDEYIKEDNSGVAQELSDKMNKYKICSCYIDDIESLKLPQFCHKVEGTLFDDMSSAVPITREDLTDGFSLSSIAVPRDLSTSADNVFKIDVETNSEGSVAKQFILKKNESEEFKSILQMIPEKTRIKACKEKLVYDLNSKFNCISYQDLVSYINRIVDSITKEDELVDLQNNIMSVELKIKIFIENEIDNYRYKKFKDDLNIGKIFLAPTYQFPKFIYPSTSISQFPKTMYSEEEDSLTDVEIDFVTKVSGLDNVLCWHRNIEKKDFCLNGYLNHYPDFIVVTKTKKVILVETKGEHLANDDSKMKLELGTLWSNHAGPNTYKYFMVFMRNPMSEEFSYQVDKVIDVIKNL